MAELKPTPRYSQILTTSARIAPELGHSYIGVEHLFLAIIEDPATVPTQLLGTLTDVTAVDAALRELMASDSYNTPTRNVWPPEE